MRRVRLTGAEGEWWKADIRSTWASGWIVIATFHQLRQQKALENEPGFRDLPPQTQQRLRNQLTQLNNMTPEQRRRTIEHNEVMEHLTPPQRQQVHGALEQFRGLPPDRQRLVGRAFRDLREMPEPQRQAFLNSDHFRGQFSDQERSTLSNLLAVEPYLAVQHPNEGPAVGK